ncbi:hypothetical protein QL285_079873 [Trifolium repens]|nr:hypothetical protein QL285_079873 [Trifolium repens]
MPNHHISLPRVFRHSHRNKARRFRHLKRHGNHNTKPLEDFKPHYKGETNDKTIPGDPHTKYNYLHSRVAELPSIKDFPSVGHDHKEVAKRRQQP